MNLALAAALFVASVLPGQSELRNAQTPRLQGRAAADADDRAQTESLLNARRLADELRYEEAVVEYQRYLAVPDRPVSERSRALFELGFIHFVLGDERNAQLRAFEALELDETLRLPADAASKQARFLETMRQRFVSRTRVEVLPPEDPDAPQRIRARLIDPQGNAHRVLLRHALGPSGPYFGQTMSCSGELCSAELAPPQGAQTYTAWYWVEAVDAQSNTVAKGASADAPLRVSIVEKAAWYKSPWVYAGGAAAVIGAAAVFFVASEPPGSR